MYKHHGTGYSDYEYDPKNRVFKTCDICCCHESGQKSTDKREPISFNESEMEPSDWLSVLPDS